MNKLNLTNASIVYEKENGSFHYRNHLQEGTLQLLGKTLITHFKNEKLLSELFKLNRNFSSINNTVEEEEIRKNQKTNLLFKSIIKIESQLTDNKVGDIVAKCYAFDLQLKVGLQKFSHLKDIFIKCDTPYVYFYSAKKKWFVSKDKGHFIPLDLALKIEKSHILQDQLNTNKDINPEEILGTLVPLAYEIMIIYSKASQYEKNKMKAFIYSAEHDENNPEKFINYAKNFVVPDVPRFKK